MFDKIVFFKATNQLLMFIKTTAWLRLLLINIFKIMHNVNTFNNKEWYDSEYGYMSYLCSI